MNEDERLFAKRALAAATQPVPLGGFDFDIHRWLNEVFADPDLSSNTKLVASALREYCAGNQSICWPTLDQIASKLGKDTDNSKRLSTNTSELAGKGYLQRVKRYEGRAANWVYRLKHPYSPQIQDQLILDAVNVEAYWASESAKWTRRPV